MGIHRAFAQSLREVRLARGLVQEDFDQTSSRVYISKLERGIQSPTLSKLEAIAAKLKVHPLTLLTLTYVKMGHAKDATRLHEIVAMELAQLQKSERRSRASRRSTVRK